MTPIAAAACVHRPPGWNGGLVAVVLRDLEVEAVTPSVVRPKLIGHVIGRCTTEDGAESIGIVTPELILVLGIGLGIARDARHRDTDDVLVDAGRQCPMRAPVLIDRLPYLGQVQDPLLVESHEALLAGRTGQVQSNADGGNEYHGGSERGDAAHRHCSSALSSSRIAQR